MNKRMQISVEEYTTPSPISVTPMTPIEEIRDIMQEESIRHIPVMEGKQPVGIVSERDIHILTRHTGDSGLTAAHVMTPGPLTIKKNLPLEKAAFELSQYKIGSALVVDENQELIGIFTTTDALNALIEVTRGDV